MVTLMVLCLATRIKSILVKLICFVSSKTMDITDFIAVPMKLNLDFGVTF